MFEKNGDASRGERALNKRSSEQTEEREVRIRVDGNEVAFPEGSLLVKLLNRLERKIPQICYHDGLGRPLETCDTCIVQVDGQLKRSCATKIVAGMRVSTDSKGAVEAREEAMHRILGNHELYCTVCDFNNGNCEVHNSAELLGIEHLKYDFEPKPYDVDDSNPFYRYDPDQCILCARCVEACQNVQVTETLTIDWNADQPRVLWDGGSAINESSCVSCGHCVTVCPCNALMEKTMLGEAGHFTSAPWDSVVRPSIEIVKHLEEFTGNAPLFATSNAEAAMREQTIKRTKTVCVYCGVGCSFDIWTRGRKILKVEPNAEAPANGISTCIKGKFAWDFVNSEERLTHPLVRREGKFERASWDEALDKVAHTLRGIAEEHGPDSVAFVASSKCTNEEAYLMQKMARAVFGTNNIDNCTRYCQSPATKGLSRTVGYGGDSGTMRDIEMADVVFIIGSHTATSHPVLASHIKRQQKLRGQYIMVADLLEHEMARRADLFLRPNPGTDLIWVNAVARCILDRGWEDRDFIERRVNDFEAYRESLEPYTLAYAEGMTGIPAEKLEHFAEKVAKAEKVCGLWAMGITQHQNGSDTSTAISNLLLLTGNYGRPGTGGYPLRGHNNVQGTCDFGAMPQYLPGYDMITEDEHRRRYEEGWGVSLSREPGLNNKTMLDAIHEGKLKALFIMGEEMALVDANLNYVEEALEKVDFLVVQEIFMSVTATFADVVLAGAPSLEKEGTFVNTERRIQRLYRALDPLGEARPDWEVLTDLARRLGHDWDYAHPGEIMEEIVKLAPLFAGVTYERLEGYKSLLWPVKEDGTDRAVLYTEEFNFPDGRARFFPVEWTEPSGKPDEAFDLHLNNGRVLEQFHEGNLTYKTPGTKEKVSGAFVEMSPGLAEERGLEEGDWVRLTSRNGTLETRVVVSDVLRMGELYMPVCSTEERVNILSSNAHDPVVDTPAYKEVAVRMEKLGRKGASPMPRTNPRYGHPTPQKGVEVDRKWKRPDYMFPTSERPKGGNV